MTKKIIVLLLLIPWFWAGTTKAIAVVEPWNRPNNKIGIHVLDPSELSEASKLVNGQNGAWGYVTVPIQATDRDRVKWIRFMKEAKEKRVIPIIRVATLVQNVNWEEPNNYDLVDFANFLNDLPWPTKNRYVIIFNEVNRADEFGGFVSPERYADILMNAVTIFKERNEDFFIIPAGLDNAAATTGHSLHWRSYWERVFQRQPEIVNRIDGWSSHSYPNPAFRGSPLDRHDRSVSGFRHELILLGKYTRRRLPVFITETGWDMREVGDEKAADYLRYAYNSVWNDEQIAAVTPFLLRAGAGPFVGFSFYKENGEPKLVYSFWQELARQGDPELNLNETPLTKDGGVGTPSVPTARSIAERLSGVDWSEINRWLSRVFGLNKTRVNIEKVISVGERQYKVEVAETKDELASGLSGRSRLHNDEGMLFVFEESGMHRFWMKGMKFDLDIVWIKEGKVIEIDKAYFKEPYKNVSPPEAVDHVLEVNIDSAIKVGDEVLYDISN